jgi:hypothetical protein
MEDALETGRERNGLETVRGEDLSERGAAESAGREGDDLGVGIMRGTEGTRRGGDASTTVTWEGILGG